MISIFLISFNICLVACLFQSIKNPSHQRQLSISDSPFTDIYSINLTDSQVSAMIQVAQRHLSETNLTQKAHKIIRDFSPLVGPCWSTFIYTEPHEEYLSCQSQYNAEGTQPIRFLSIAEVSNPIIYYDFLPCVSASLQNWSEKTKGSNLTKAQQDQIDRAIDVASRTQGRQLSANSRYIYTSLKSAFSQYWIPCVTNESGKDSAYGIKVHSAQDAWIEYDHNLPYDWHYYVFLENDF